MIAKQRTKEAVKSIKREWDGEDLERGRVFVCEFLGAKA